VSDVVKRAREMMALAHSITDFDSTEAARLCDENNEPPTCVMCGGEYRITEYGDDPSALDDTCAHAAASVLASALIVTVARIEKLEALLLGTAGFMHGVASRVECDDLIAGRLLDEAAAIRKELNDE
jgi:hypothetical protein